MDNELANELTMEFLVLDNTTVTLMLRVRKGVFFKGRLVFKDTFLRYLLYFFW
jgi:hypothetical protein